MVTGAPLVRVLGLGNVLMGDDALGPWVVHTLLSSYEFPPEVSVLDVGTPGLDLVPYVAGPGGIIFVDSVKSSAPAGTVRIYDRNALVNLGTNPRLSPHDPGVAEALLAVDMADDGPAWVRLVGVVPGNVSTGVGMTAEVQSAVTRAAEIVVAELLARGLDVRCRPWGASSVELPWWEVPVLADAPPPAPLAAPALAPETEAVLV